MASGSSLFPFSHQNFLSSAVRSPSGGVSAMALFCSSVSVVQPLRLWQVLLDGDGGSRLGWHDYDGARKPVFQRIKRGDLSRLSQLGEDTQMRWHSGLERRQKLHFEGPPAVRLAQITLLLNKVQQHPNKQKLYTLPWRIVNVGDQAKLNVPSFEPFRGIFSFMILEGCTPTSRWRPTIASIDKD